MYKRQDVGYTAEQINGECEYTVHKWVDGKNKWDVNGRGNPSYFDLSLIHI